MTPVTPLISALTGHLPFLLITAALLTWPISAALLAIYTRAVKRSMRKMAGRQHESQGLPGQPDGRCDGGPTKS